MFQFGRGEDAWRRAIDWIEAVFFCRPLAVQFPAVAKRAVAANGAAAPLGTADAPKKALSKRRQATPRGGTPAIAPGGRLKELASAIGSANCRSRRSPWPDLEN